LKCRLLDFGLRKDHHVDSEEEKAKEQQVEINFNEEPGAVTATAVRHILI